MKGLAISIVAAVSVGACVSAPPVSQPQTDVSVPPSWTATAESATSDAVAAGWWTQFGDPQLTATIEHALTHNTDLLAATARVEQAAAAARIAGADLNPQLGTSFSGTRAKRNFVGFPIPGGKRVLTTLSSTVGVSLDLSWEVDLWGRLGAQAREGLVTYQAGRADLEGVRLSVAGQTAKAWFAVAEARQQVRLAEETVVSFQRSADQVRDRFERGVRPPLDLRLALAQLASAQAALQARKQQLDATSRQLEILIGRYPDKTLEFPQSLGETPTAIPPGLPADLVGRRPDLAAAERRLVAADQRYRGARASLYPRLSLTASGGISSNQLGDLVKGDFSVWSLLGNLTAPLFQAGRLRAGVDLAAAGIDETFATYVGTALRAYGEVETALTAEELLATQVRFLEDTSQQSRAAQDLAESRYRSGLADYTTVLESQRRTFESQSAYLAGRRQRLDNRVDLILALGGGFDAQSILLPPAATPGDDPQENSR